jgi:hypothetical protein
MDVFVGAINNLLDRVRALEAQPSVGGSYTTILSNGGFEVWSGGSGPFTTNGPSADNWDLNIGAGSAMSVSEDSTHQDAMASAHCAAVTYTHTLVSYLQQSVSAPFANTPVAVSVRIRTAVPNAVRITCGGKSSPYHPGNDLYQTLAVVGVPMGSPFLVQVELDATCLVYVDSAMCVQGAHPIEYIYTT